VFNVFLVLQIEQIQTYENLTRRVMSCFICDTIRE